MRPILAVIGAGLLVVLALLGYFIPGGYSATGSVNAASPVLVDVPTSDTFLPSVPVQVVVSGVPAGGIVRVIPCPTTVASASACTSTHPGLVDTVVMDPNASAPGTVTLEVNLNAGHQFVLNTSTSVGAPASFKVTSPLWAVQTYVFLGTLIASLVLIGAGLSGHPVRSSSAPRYVEESGYAGGAAPPRRFCESCGEPFPDDTTAFCTSCGTPRW